MRPKSCHVYIIRDFIFIWKHSLGTILSLKLLRVCKSLYEIALNGKNYNNISYN